MAQWFVLTDEGSIESLKAMLAKAVTADADAQRGSIEIGENARCEEGRPLPGARCLSCGSLADPYCNLPCGH